MIIPVGFAQVTHVFGGPVLPYGAVTTYGINQPSIVSPTDFVDDIHGFFVANVMPNVNEFIDVIETRIKLGPNDIGPAYAGGLPAQGAVTGTGSPPNVAFLVEKNTAAGGRANRGRMFLPGVTESYVTDSGALIPAAVADWQVALDAWLEDLDTNGSPMVLLHSASSDPTTVASLTIDGRVATQRRRLRR